MILSFKKLTPDREPTNFPMKIRIGEKIHTFRLGDRWSPGIPIHFWDGSPRNQRDNPSPFEIHRCMAKELVEHNGQLLPACYAVEPFRMKFHAYRDLRDQLEFLWIGKWHVPGYLMPQVASQDGLTLRQFKSWFFKTALDLQVEKMKLEGNWIARMPALKQPKMPNWIHLSGQIIHWTDKIYRCESAITIETEKLSKRQFGQCGDPPIRIPIIKCEVPDLNFCSFTLKK